MNAMASGPRTSYTLEEARIRMERYCAYRERCHQEVVAKLKEMRMIPDAIDAIVVHLIEAGFLNEERFAREFARGKFRQKGWGRVRIRRELRMRDISDYLVRSALEGIEPGEYAKCLESMARKRWEQLGEEGDLRRKKRKLADFLIYRGWEPDRVLEMASELAAEDGRGSQD